MSQNRCWLIISPEELARIQATCQLRAAELEAAGIPHQLPDAVVNRPAAQQQLEWSGPSSRTRPPGRPALWCRTFQHQLLTGAVAAFIDRFRFGFNRDQSEKQRGQEQDLLRFQAGSNTLTCRRWAGTAFRTLSENKNSLNGSELNWRTRSKSCSLEQS